MRLGSDKSSGGAHRILRTEVDIVLLLPVDPVGAGALPVQDRKRNSGVRFCNVHEDHSGKIMFPQVRFVKIQEIFQDIAGCHSIPL